MDFVAIILALLFCYALFSLMGTRKPNNLPPGPTPLPIIGNLHQLLLGHHPHQSLAKLAKFHGPIMSLRLGRITTLVISSAAAAKMVLQTQDLAFSNRYAPDALHAHNHLNHSVIWLPVGTQWRNLRKTFSSNIFCVQNGANQHLRRQKVQQLVEYCQKASASKDSVDMGLAAFRTSLNILSNTIFSKDLTQDSGKELKEVVENIMVEIGKPNLVDFFPVLRRIDPQGIRRRTRDLFGEVMEIFEGLIEERLEMRKTKWGNDDVLDICLNVCEQRPEELDRSSIKNICQDLFAAGTDTTSSTIEWAMTEMLRNPRTMAKAKDELKQVLGKGKTVEENEICRLPYLCCIMKETLRIHPPAPLLLPRKVESQVEVNGYMVPKGAQVLVNAWAIGRDERTWKDPLEFKPERFLTIGHEFRGSDFDVIPFGGGRRMCPGLPLATRIIPMILGSLLNNFDWKLERNEMDMTEKYGLSLHKAEPLRIIPMPLA